MDKFSLESIKQKFKNDEYRKYSISVSKEITSIKVSFVNDINVDADFENIDLQIMHIDKTNQAKSIGC